MKLACLFLLLLPSLVFGQGAAEKLKQSREKTLREIEYANKLLLETQGKAKQSLNEINIINHKLGKRREYLVGLEVEVNVINLEIEKVEQDVYRTEQEINRIKDMYALMIRNLYKNKIPEYRSMYFLASGNFNQLYKRIHTVKLYNNYLKQEKARLAELLTAFSEEKKELLALRANKDVLLNQTKSETITIQREVNEKSKLVKQLKQRQKEIEEEIRNKEKTAKKLENELKKLVEEEVKKSKGKRGYEALTPEDKIVSVDFEKNSGKLPWPTQRGIISGKYGEHQHPDYKNVTVRNDGVYISTAVGEKARAVFKGVVSKVFTIPGANYAVIIKHGQYFSLYHNLINVQVKPGQAVNTKDIIGTVYTDDGSNETVLYFQIWKSTEHRDPELWLAPL